MKVIVAFGQRRKWVTFGHGLQELRKAFSQMLEKDFLCREAFLSGKMCPIEPARIIFQWPVNLDDPNSPLVEIEEDDAIPDRCTCITAFYQNSYTSDISTSSSHTVDLLAPVANEQTSMESDSNNVYTETFGTMWNSSPDESSFSQSSLTHSPEAIPLAIEMDENDDFSASASESVDNTGETDHNTSMEKNQNHLIKGTLTYPCELPSLSPSLTKARQEGMLHVKRRQFMKELRIFFLQKVPNPTKFDYQVYSQTVVDAYPEFRTKEPGLPYWSGLKSMLVGSITCSRYYEKNLEKRRRGALQRYHENSMKRSKTNERLTSKVVLSQLEKELLEGSITSDKTKLLLENTFERRRETLTDIQDPASKCAAFPFLRNIDLALMELKLMLPQGARDQLLPNFHSNFTRLVEVFGRLENLHEEDQCKLLLKLNDTLIHARLRKEEPPLIVCREVGDHSDSFPAASSSTFAVVFTEGNNIKSCNIVVVNQIFLSVENNAIPLSYVVLLLLATYRILSIQFPKHYNILHVIDRFCLSGVVDITVHQNVLKAAEKLSRILGRE